MTRLDAPTNRSAEGAGADQRPLVQLIVAAVLMGATGVMLVWAGVWALTFTGLMSKELSGALNGHMLTSAGVLMLVVGLVVLVCVVGVLIGPTANRWVGLVASLAGIVIGAVAAFTGIWLVHYYPGWAVTYTALGALVVFALTSYERGLHAEWPWNPVHALVAGILLNVWFLVTLSAAAGLPAGASAHPWNQALAWLTGAAISLALISALWLARGRSRHPSPLPEIPDDLPPIKLSRPIVLFVLIRAIAVSGAIAIAFGLNLTNADWTTANWPVRRRRRRLSANQELRRAS